MRDILLRARAPVSFWLVFAAIRVFVGGFGEVRLGPDDLTRLAQIDALLGGQGWWDLTLDRLGIDGVAMHWTRHVDALFLLLGGGTEAYRMIALIVLPLLLGLAAFALVGAIAETVGGKEAVPAALLLLLASVLTSVQFAPGRIDHHGLQIVLVLLAVLGLVRLERPGWALAGGIALGLSLSIGLEQALVAAGVMLGVGMVVVGSDVDRRAVDRLAIGLVAGVTGGALVFAPPSRLLQIACDVFSLQHLLVVVLAAIGLAAAVRARRRGPVLFGSWAVAGVVGIGLAPRCVDPYADVAPLLREAWLPRVSEAQGILEVLSGRLGFGLAVLVPAAVAIGFLGYRVFRDRSLITPVGRVFPVLLLAFAGAFIQLRSASAATAVGAVVLGVLVAELRVRLGRWAMVPRAAVLGLVVIVISGMGPLLVGAGLDEGSSTSASVGSISGCAEGFAVIGVGEVVAAPMDLGPELLHRTDAHVLAGPYHRNGDGNLLAWELLGAPADESGFRAAGVDWVALCDGIPEQGIIESEFGPGLLADLEDGVVPAFLEEVATDAVGLRLYRVTD